MSTEFINVLTAFAVSVIYLILTIKVISPFFLSITKPMNNATGVLFFFVVLGFGIQLFSISDVATSSLHFHNGREEFSKGIGNWFLFSGIAFAISFLFFRISYFIVGLSTPQNEKTELAKNNFTIAGLHAVVFIIISLVASKPLSNLINTLVEYPETFN
jgi:hypothetical protein